MYLQVNKLINTEFDLFKRVGAVAVAYDMTYIVMFPVYEGLLYYLYTCQYFLSKRHLPDSFLCSLKSWTQTLLLLILHREKNQQINETVTEPTYMYNCKLAFICQQDNCKHFKFIFTCWCHNIQFCKMYKRAWCYIKILYTFNHSIHFEVYRKV